MNSNPSQASSHYRISIAAAMVYAILAFFGMRTSASASELPVHASSPPTASALLDPVIVSAKRLVTVLDPVVVTASRRLEPKLVLAPVFVFIADKPDRLFASGIETTSKPRGSIPRGILARVRGWFGSASL